MAKAKHSPALFEVIARSRPRNSQGRLGFIGAVTQWFRRKPKGTGVSMPATPAPAPAPAAPVAPVISEVEHTPEPMRPVVEPAAGPVRRTAITIDPDRYEITLRLSYASAIIGAFAVITVVAAAFAAGRGTGAGARPLFADRSSTELHEQDPISDVLKVDRGTTVETQPQESEAASPSQQTAGPRQSGQTAKSRTRTAGLNYVIIQSYPKEEMASEAVKLLAENGIDSTVEQKLPGWASGSWYIVVGLEGFDKLSNSPRYDAYLKKIRDISDKYAKKTSFKAFTPTPYKWGGRAK